jgi:NADH-dependent peroxiredoxin subunit F
MENNQYDLIIIGGGPAGAAAGVYAARKQLKTALITESFGGQSVVSGCIENWIGSPKIGGAELAIALEEHVRAQTGITIREPERATEVKKSGKGFSVRTDKDRTYECRAVVITSGGRHRRLNVPGGTEFDGRGVAYCSTCDAPVFSGKNVAVIGSGNAGLEAVRDLDPYAKNIYIFDITPEPTGDPKTAEQVMNLANVKFFGRSEITALSGDSWLKRINYRNLDTAAVKTLEVEGAFIAIGAVPNSEIVKGLVDVNERGEIVVSRPSYATSCPGIFAAGDVTDDPYRQNNIAAGDAIKAVLSAVIYLSKTKL